MKRALPSSSIHVSCAVCEKLHAPQAPDAANPICTPCRRERLPAARLPRWMSGRRRHPAPS